MSVTAATATLRLALLRRARAGLCMPLGGAASAGRRARHSAIAPAVARAHRHIASVAATASAPATAMPTATATRRAQSALVAPPVTAVAKRHFAMSAAATAAVPTTTAAATKPAAAAGSAGAADPHALPVVTYAFSGPLNPVLSTEEIKNDNPYADWEKHPAYAPFMASKLLHHHNAFRDDVKRMSAALRGAAAVGDSAWNAFRDAFHSTWAHLDGHHRIEDDVVFPQLDALYGPRAAAAQYGAGAAAAPGLMDCPRMRAEHTALLTRTAAVLAMLSAEPQALAGGGAKGSAKGGSGQGTAAAAADGNSSSAAQQLLRDTKAEFGGWSRVLMEHLRDEEALVVPLMLSAADKLKLPPPPPTATGAGAGVGAGAGNGAAKH